MKSCMPSSLADADRVGQLLVLLFEDQLLAPSALKIMISHVGTRPTPGLIDGSSFWATIPFMLKAMALRRAVCMSCGEQVENTADRGRRARGVDRAEHQVARFGRVDGRHERFLVAHFAHQHDVGVFAHRVLHADLEVLHVQADLALVDQALVLGEDEFDRVFERQDVLAVARG